MLAWKIYYEDGSSFDDSTGEPSDAPAQGVIAIQQQTGCEHHPKEIFKNGDRVGVEDWYWWRADLACWLYGDRDGLLDQVMNCGAIAAKQGRMTGHRRWEELWTALSHDPDFPS